MRLLSVIFLLLVAFSCAPEPKTETIFFNGTILSIDDENSVYEAMMIRGDKIVALGSSENMLSNKTESTVVVDLDGKTIMPGIIEGHGHLIGMGELKMGLELQNSDTWEDIVSLVETAAKDAQPGEWIIGRGWHQEKWTEKPEELAEGYPLNSMLNRAAPNNPVLLTHVSGHADIVNDAALKAAGITENTPDPENGRIVRAKSGLPTGVFQGSARQPVFRAYGAWMQTLPESERREKAQKVVELAIEECLSYGITSFQDAGSSFSDIDLYKELIDEDRFDLRMYAMIRQPLDRLKKNLADYKTLGYKDNKLTVRAVKLSLDGALGARSAWMIRPYSDEPLISGINYFSIEMFEDVAREAHKHGYQMCTHAIGDRANRETLSMYERLFDEYGQSEELRWRIEHAQHLHPTDIPRFGELGVIASIQAVHATSDGPWVPVRIGEERANEGAYRWRDFLDTNARIVNGTDAPVESVDPWANLKSTVTRKMNNGEYFTPSQALTPIEALRSVTIDAAYAAFEESIKGSLEPGKLADFIVIDRNPLEIEPHTMDEIVVNETWLGGEKKFIRSNR